MPAMLQSLLSKHGPLSRTSCRGADGAGDIMSTAVSNRFLMPPVLCVSAPGQTNCQSLQDPPEAPERSIVSVSCHGSSLNPLTSMIFALFG